MKLYSTKSDDTLPINIDINFQQSNAEIAATAILPIIHDINSHEVSEQARADFAAFVENLFETISYYDFEILDDFKHTSKSFPETSEYRWIAHRTELDADNVPRYIKLRVSDHFQHFSKNRVKQLTEQSKMQAEALKKPTSKKTQRYEMINIVVNGDAYNTYEEALAEIEKMIFKWLERRGIDVSDYDMLG